MAFKRLFPLQIAQDGATNNQVLAWNGSKWTPSSLSNIGGTSIYTGSGTIGNNVAGSTTNATLPSGNTAFNFRYFGGNNGFTVQGNGVNSGTLQLKNLANTFGLQVNDLDMVLIYPNGSTSFESGKMTINDTVVFLDTVGVSPDPNALLEVSSTTKVFFPPRMDTTQRDAIGAVSDGAIVYNIQSDTLDLRANGSWVSLMDNNSVITASNGLTKNVNDIRLGGTLTANTTINNNNANKLTVDGQLAGGGNYIFNVSNAHATGGGTQSIAAGTGAAIQGLNNGTGTGVSGYAVGGGSGVTGQSESGGIAGWFTTEDSSNNSVITGMSVFRNVTGGAGIAGAGVRLEFGAETSTTTNTRSNAILSEWTTATHATRTSKLSFTTLNGGTEATKLELAGTGQLKLNSYGGGTFSGTATKTLQVDSAGNVIEGNPNPPGIGGIYGGSGTIAVNAVATLPATKTFTVAYASNQAAFQVDDSIGWAQLLAKTVNKGAFTAQNTSALMSFASVTFVEAASNTVTIRANEGDSSESSFIVSSADGFQATSTTRGFLLPRLDTTAQNAIPSPTNGLHIYNTTLAKHSFYQGSAWVQYMVDTAGVGGIYKGSGTIASACISTATANSYWRVKYAGTAGTAIFVDSTTGNELLELKGKDSGSYGGLTLDTDSAFLYEASSSQGVFVTDSLTQITSDWTELTGIAQASNVVTPATFGVAQHNYNTQNAVFLRLETTVNDTQVTGFAHGKGLGNSADAGGRIIWVTNIGAVHQIRFMGNNAGSDAEYRFISTRIIAAGETHGLYYDPTAQRWRWLQGS